jgi:hypothetical protein
LTLVEKLELAQRVVRQRGEEEGWVDFAWKIWNTRTKQATQKQRKQQRKRKQEKEHQHVHEHEEFSFSATPSSHRHTSRTFASDSSIINNDPPTLVPPARTVTSITDVGDGAHWAMTVLMGRGNLTGPNLPDSGSISLKLVLDLGSGDLALFNRTDAASKCTDGSADCVKSMVSLSFQPDATHSTSQGPHVTVDGEVLGCDDGFFGSDLFTLQSNVIGTNQVEYKVETITSWVGLGNSVYSVRLGNDRNPNRRTTNFDDIDNPLINAAYMDRADGVLGMAFASASTVRKEYAAQGSAFYQIAGSTAPFFSLDLTDGQLVLGGIHEAWRDKLVWSSGPVDLFEEYHSFRLSSLSICGVDLFQNLTSTWPAIIDSGASCLGLPAEFFDMVISWMPLRCGLGKLDSVPRICYVSSEVRTGSLPTITFKLSEFGSDLYIDLSELLFPTSSSVPNRMCIYRGASVIGGPSPYNSIVFGGRVLKQFYAAFSMEDGNGRVGFANKVATLTESRVQCASRVACKGMEVHYDPLNLCLPPPCADYYFFETDEETRTCKLVSGGQRHADYGRETRDEFVLTVLLLLLPSLHSRVPVSTFSVVSSSASSSSPSWD